jgi:flagellar motor switch protein FliN
VTDEAMPMEEGTGHGAQGMEDEATGHRPQATEPALEAVEAVPEPSDLPPPTLDLSEPEPDPAVDLAAHLLDVKVRFWAELGRARLPLAQTVALGTGAIVDLDKDPDDELDVLVNGLPFAKAKLLLVDGEWAIRLDEIVATPQAVEHASNSGSGA